MIWDVSIVCCNCSCSLVVIFNLSIVVMSWTMSFCFSSSCFSIFLICSSFSSSSSCKIINCPFSCLMDSIDCWCFSLNESYSSARAFNFSSSTIWEDFSFSSSSYWLDLIVCSFNNCWRWFFSSRKSLNWLSNSVCCWLRSKAIASKCSWRWVSSFWVNWVQLIIDSL